MHLEQAIKQAYSLLYFNGDILKHEKWQSVTAPANFLEVINVIFRAEMVEGPETLAKMVKADLPWAEDHFLERINGKALNPGKQWENWPYYRADKDDERFRNGGKFSHTYMERFWAFDYHTRECDLIDAYNKEEGGPVPIFGHVQPSRYPAGDYGQIIERAIQDPTSRQLYLSIWHPEDQFNDGDEGEVARRLPCSLGYHFLIRNGYVHLTYHIRSCDIMRHFRNDIYLAVRLAQDFRDKVNSKLTMGTFTMCIGSLHCWEAEKSLLRKHFLC